LADQPQRSASQQASQTPRQSSNPDPQDAKIESEKPEGMRISEEQADPKRVSYVTYQVRTERPVSVTLGPADKDEQDREIHAAIEAALNDSALPHDARVSSIVAGGREDINTEYVTTG